MTCAARKAQHVFQVTLHHQTAAGCHVEQWCLGVQVTHKKLDIGASVLASASVLSLDVLAICQPDSLISFPCHLTGVHLGPANLASDTLSNVHIHVQSGGTYQEIEYGKAASQLYRSNVAGLTPSSSLQSLRNQNFVGLSGHVNYEVRHRASVPSACVSRRIGARQCSCRGDRHV